MLTSSQKFFSYFFFFIVIIELLCTSLESLRLAHYFSKPLILTSLIIFLYFESNTLSIKTKVITFAALIFSLLGDVLLMFVDLSPNYFLAGLAAFLSAHITYIFLFLNKRNSNAKPIAYITVLLIYAAILFYLLHNYLGDMLIPVIVYVFAILLMAITAALRKDSVNTLSFNFVLIGALLFVISDSVLAINKFHSAFSQSGIIIMLTYALAQYFIVIGILKQEN